MRMLNTASRLLRLVLVLFVGGTMTSASFAQAQQADSPPEAILAAEESGAPSVASALAAAVEKKDRSLLTIALKSNNRVTRLRAIELVQTALEPGLQRELLVATLQAEDPWVQTLYHSGDENTIYYLYFENFAFMLKQQGVNVTRMELLQKPIRERVLKTLLSTSNRPKGSGFKF